ncbi:putative competence protein precursor [Acetoanaerobium sticklandii]|uniref:Putative competence protein n=1 Tax=Acetoanaerobium sticklandii (strain ATCC 12662 / DSM 519 / JCM 1433 / CCUG 9281 / NCIMB 10654 / HF) TaxID=499177 RepID=E3PRH7_ACESD|nr:helix-hairpin-helix domain-containing protein [Acetoanaerobium sticklandii]CBH21481.1 putative competence protein precursor [Acetoanaerobium sticklandii]
MKNKNKYLLITIILVFTLLTVMVINLNANSKEYIIGDTDSSIMQDESIADDTEEENYEQEENSNVTVFVSGEVLNQRVVEIEKGKRLIDAVEICGGLTEKADLNAVNLALVLEEEGHYIIPAIGDTNVLNVTNLNQMNSSSNLVNINSADIELLKTLPGVGDVLGQRILDKRDELGKFTSINQLNDVSGIGDKKFSDIKDKVTID